MIVHDRGDDRQATNTAEAEIEAGRKRLDENDAADLDKQALLWIEPLIMVHSWLQRATATRPDCTPRYV